MAVVAAREAFSRSLRHGLISARMLKRSDHPTALSPLDEIGFVRVQADAQLGLDLLNTAG